MITTRLNRGRHPKLYEDVFLRWASAKGYRTIRCDGEQATHAICLAGHDPVIVPIGDAAGKGPWRFLIANASHEPAREKGLHL